MQSVLLIVGGSDRLLPSVNEAQRLQKILPNSKMVVLPNSGHACLLEEDINLYGILQQQNFVEPQIQQFEQLVELLEIDTPHG